MQAKRPGPRLPQPKALLMVLSLRLKWNIEKHRETRVSAMPPFWSILKVFWKSSLGGSGRDENIRCACCVLSPARWKWMVASQSEQMCHSFLVPGLMSAIINITRRFSAKDLAPGNVKKTNENIWEHLRTTYVDGSNTVPKMGLLWTLPFLERVAKGSHFILRVWGLRLIRVTLLLR